MPFRPNYTPSLSSSRALFTTFSQFYYRAPSYSVVVITHVQYIAKTKHRHAFQQRLRGQGGRFLVLTFIYSHFRIFSNRYLSHKIMQTHTHMWCSSFHTRSTGSEFSLSSLFLLNLLCLLVVVLQASLLYLTHTHAPLLLLVVVVVAVVSIQQERDHM